MPADTPASRRRVIVFDVNETLLDIEVLQPLFVRMFSEHGAMRQWFGQVILYSEVLTMTGLYMEFGQLAVGALKMFAKGKGVELGRQDIDALRQAMQQLPPHPDAAGALTRLRDAGFRLATLTNSAPKAAAAQMAHAGLGDFFERQFSVDAVRKFKPAAETYRQVAGAMGVDLSQLRLVAAHTWDTIGAQQAGCAAALVTRPGNAPLPDAPQPDIVEPDLEAVAERIIAIEAAS